MGLVYKFSHMSGNSPVWKGILTAKIGTDRKAEEAQRRAKLQKLREFEEKGQLRLEEIGHQEVI